MHPSFGIDRVGVHSFPVVHIRLQLLHRVPNISLLDLLRKDQTRLHFHNHHNYRGFQYLFHR